MAAIFFDPGLIPCVFIDSKFMCYCCKHQFGAQYGGIVYPLYCVFTVWLESQEF